MITLTEIQKKLLKITPRFLKANYSETEPIYTNRMYKKFSSEIRDFDFSVDDLIYVLDYIIEDMHIMDGLKRYDSEDSYWMEDGELCYDEEDSEGWIYYIDTFNIGMDEYKLFSDRFISNNNGFESGLTLLNRIYFTLMIPRKLEVTSNNYENALSDRGIPRSLTSKVKVNKPLVPITADNIEYLKMLDIIKMYAETRYPFNIYNPIKKMQKMIEEKKLEYKTIKALASKYPFEGELDKYGEPVNKFVDTKLNKLINKIRHYY